jgi:hypothetical protein
MWDTRAGVFGVLALAALLSAGPASAQDTTRLARGQRVRVSPWRKAWPSATGQLVALDDGGILIRRDSAHVARYDWRDIRRVEISRGRRNGADKGRDIGALVGFLAGAVVGVRSAPYSLEHCPDFPDRSQFNFAERCAWEELVDVGWTLAIGFVGALPGAAIGALIGLPFHYEMWEEAPPERLTVRVAPLRGGTLGVGLALAF